MSLSVWPLRYPCSSGEIHKMACLAVSVKVCQLLAVGRWFPPGTPVSSTSETDISSSSSPPRYDPGCC